jgi:U3 small nucleolar RNA-associated protein MPP10
LEDAEMDDDAMEGDGEDDDALDLEQWAPNAKARGAFDDSSAEENELIGERGDKISRFEAQQDRLRRKISQLEDEAVAPKQWQLIGEVRGVKRPENSLLAETLEFEHATKVAPPVSEERMRSIEELVKKRILDQAFDDVIRRKADDITKGDSRQSTSVLDSEKSKKVRGTGCTFCSGRALLTFQFSVTMCRVCQRFMRANS